MAGNMEPTPRVMFLLDNSELIRLNKLRAVLKLAHWGKIGGVYELEIDETVAKSIKTLENNVQWRMTNNMPPGLTATVTSSCRG